MKIEKPAPTMKDVAQEAGVALGTVSKVMNGIPVGESYRLKVEESAQKLGYQVNNYARGLKTNKTYSVALIIPSLINPFFAGLAQAIARELALRNHRMLLFITDFDPETEQDCIHMVRQNKVDGVIGVTYNPDLEIHENLPFVAIDRFFNSTTPCVSSDNFGGGYLAAEKLVEFGCKKLVFFKKGSAVRGETDKRGEGFQTFCQSKGIAHEVLRVLDEDGLTPFRSFLEAHLHEGRLDFDGIFCATDKLAYDVRNMLSQLGISVPEDVQLIGFDGIRKFGNREPFCSTILQPVDAIAKTCVDILLSPDNQTRPAVVCLPVQYLPGETTRDIP